MPIQGEMMEFRSIGSDDLAIMADMMNYLGYPTHPHELERIVSNIIENPWVDVFFAVDSVGMPVGLISLHTLPALRLKGCLVTIDELVVHPDYRGKGIGRSLTEFAVKYAAEKKARRLELSTNRNRESYKRRFYLKNGFEEAESSVFRITL